MTGQTAQIKPRIRRLESPLEINFLQPFKDAVILASGISAPALYEGHNIFGEMVFTARDSSHTNPKLIFSISAPREHISLDNGRLKFAGCVRTNYFGDKIEYIEKDIMLWERGL